MLLLYSGLAQVHPKLDYYTLDDDTYNTVQHTMDCIHLYSLAGDFQGRNFHGSVGSAEKTFKENQLHGWVWCT